MKNTIKKMTYLSIKLLVLIGGVILLLAPSKAKAITLTAEVEPTGRRWSVGSVACTWQTQAQTSFQGQIFCPQYPTNGTTGNLTSIMDYNARDYKQGYYYTVDIFLQSTELQRMPNMMWYVSEPTGWSLIDVKEITNTKNDIERCTGSLEPIFNIVCDTGANGYNRWYQITLQATQTGTYNIEIGNRINSITRVLASSQGTMAGTGFILLADIVEYKNASVNSEQEQAGQQAQNDGNQASQNAQNETEQAGTTILSTITNIVNVVKDTEATDCNISGNLGNADLGVLNFCQGNIEPLRPAIRVIVALVMGTGAFLSLKHILKMMLNLINSYQE